jgi:hypothetical protein
LEVNAVAYLYYNEGESISSGWEGLELIVKFKEDKKLFKTRIKRKVASTYFIHNPQESILYKGNHSYSTYSEYYEVVEAWINDIEKVKKEAEDMIISHFSQKNKDQSKSDRKKSVQKMVKNAPQIEIKVKIN